MKKIIIVMAAIAAAFTMASCNKEQPVSPNDNLTTGKSVITASIENDITKTTLEGNDDEGYKVFWSEGDNLFVCDEGGSRNMNWVAEYKLEDSSIGSPKGTFSWHTGDYFISVNKSYQEPVFENGNVYVATHPFDLTDLDNFRLIWKTEQTYSTTDRYIPMYAVAECTKDDEADFKFTNLGGILRLTVKGSAYIRSIKISAAENEAMSGSFLVDEDDNDNMVGKMGYGDVENYIILDCGTNGVRLSEEGTDFYISMPCHYIIDEEIMKWVLDGYSDVTITLTDTDGKTCVKKLNNKKLFIERSKITTAKFTASEFKANVPEGALPGKFSVAEGKQVYFSKGNLWADDSNTLHFEDAQWKSTPASSGSKDASHVSHFTWTIPVEAAVIGSKIGSNLFCDEAHKQSVDGSDNIYYTLSTVEWQYLFNYWDYANEIRKDKCKWAKVNGVGGYVIAPDDFTGTLKEEYTDDAALAAAGNLVFLPAAGYYDDPIFMFVGNCGYYWSSSAFDGSLAYFVLFDSILDPVRFGSRRYGYSVRLVTDCE